MALAVFALGALAGGARAAQGAEPQSIVVTGQRAMSSWVRAESAHLVVVSDEAREDVVRLVEHLERLDGLLRLYTADYSTTAAGPEPRQNVIYLDTFDSLGRIRPELSPMLIGMRTDCVGDTQSFFMHLEPLPVEELIPSPQLDARMCRYVHRPRTCSDDTRNLFSALRSKSY